MDFALSEEQELFQRSLRGWLAENASIERVRELMESPSGHDPGLIQALARQGVTGVLVPERLGGSGLGLLDAIIAAEELGRAATPCSYHSAAVMAPLALALAGSDEQQERWLPGVAEGSLLLSYARGTLRQQNGSFNGHADFVPDAELADAFILEASDGERTRLFVIPRDAKGLRIEPLWPVDQTRRPGELLLEDVDIQDELRASNDASAVAARVVEAGLLSVAADLLGAAERTLELAVDYSLTREQFGRPIGSFQAVKHMCAETFAEVEPLRSLLWYAAFAWDDGSEDTGWLAPLVKAHASEVGTDATTTATQVFGGMGFTWDCDIQIWFKRAGHDRQLLGGPAELRERATAVHYDG